MRSTGRALGQAATGGKAVEAELPADTEAEDCFNQAIRIAQLQNAKSLELRAVMTLARLCEDQGRSEEIRGRLAQIYDTFTEGFDTKDLREAKAMLDEVV